MHPAKAISAYFAFIFVGGALLAPALYHLVQFGVTLSPVFQPLARHPFHRFVDRSFLILGVIGLWPFLRAVGIQTWAQAGLARNRGWSFRWLVMGFLTGFVSLLLAAGLTVAAGARSLNPDRTLESVIGHLVNATLAAVVVSVLEELFFRGAILGALRRSFRWGWALLVSSALYAIVHFFERPPRPDSVEWMTGLVTLAQMLRGFVDLSRLVPGFFSLLLAGWILGLGYQRLGTLHFSIGLHAGWIFWLKSYGFLTVANPDAGSWFWGSNKLIDGWAALGVLALVLAGVHHWLRGTVRTGDAKT